MPSSKRRAEAMNGEEPRKKVRLADSKTIPESTDMPHGTRLPITSSSKQEDVAISSATAEEDRKALTLLHDDFTNLRQTLTCKICERLFYEPYVLACGHTYCYSCLSTWFTSNKKRTCPDCRVRAVQAPAPCYTIKAMVNIFIKRPEILPDGETTEQHEKWQQEEADIMLKDKNDQDPIKGGLFKGVFSRLQRSGIQTFHDNADGVDRCPACFWELEDGWCMQCNREIGDHSDDSDHYADETDLSDDHPDHDDIDVAVEQRHLFGVPGNRNRVPNTIDSITEDPYYDSEEDDDFDEDEDDEEEDGSMQDFIDDDQEAFPTSPMTISSDNVSEPPHIQSRSNHLIRTQGFQPASVHLEFGESGMSSDDRSETPPAPPRSRFAAATSQQNRRRAARPIAPDSSSDNDDSDGEGGGLITYSTNPAAFSPPDLSSGTGDDHSDDDDDDDELDDDDDDGDDSDDDLDEGLDGESGDEDEMPSDWDSE